MKYLFILGRNLKLSRQEIESYLKIISNEISFSAQIKNGLLLELNNKLPSGALDFLGGTLAIGEVLSEGKLKKIVSELETLDFFDLTKGKLIYSIWNFSEESYEKINGFIKSRFKHEKIKASERHSSDSLISQSGKELEFLNSKRLIDEEYFVFGESNYFFGKIFEKCNYDEIEKRDMEKPVRREELSISPRLAKIMINLSEVKNGEVLIDCFCGIGTILIEALNLGISVIGVDKDSNAITSARQNLGFFNFPKSNYTLLNSDSKKVKIFKKGVLVCEPDLGDILKKVPKENEALQTQKNFENLMIGVLNNLKKNISTAVFTAPLIKTNKKRIGCDINPILEKTGFKLREGFPIEDFRKTQIVGREIFVLER